MKEALLREIATAYLLPFFSGAWLEPKAIPSTPFEKRVAFHLNTNSIAFKIDKADTYRLVISRSQPFTKSEKVLIPDYDVVEAFVETLSPISKMLETEIGRDILSTFQRRVVSRVLMKGEFEGILLSGIDYLGRLGSRLYEGSAISASIGFRRMGKRQPGVAIEDFVTADFGAVLSNGHDTILEFDYSGDFINQDALPQDVVVPSFCPFRQGNLGRWTTAHEARVAMSLNRLGEIMVFKAHELLFARRAGTWHFLTHEPVIKQMNVPRKPALRKALYETCLDASFARTGACFGVVQVGESSGWRKIVSQDDLLASSKSKKCQAINRIVRQRKFHSLDRRTRQELSAIDGATIVSHSGDVLAVGAILRIPSGSNGGGGRLAAARALSQFGLGIKVSQDGGILGFRPKKPDPVFRVM